MNRREVLIKAGALGAGLAGRGAAARADHGKKTGGKMMAPLAGLHLHFCGVHVAKANPKIQLITQHYCGPLGDDMHQCLLYDSFEENAKLVGVEYIISDKAFRALPAREKAYWHPHAYEVLGGGLIAPSMGEEAEMKFMKALLTTWGKTWHTWPDPTTKVPMGSPLLMWSLGGDDQVDPKVVADRDKLFGVDTAQIRAERGKEFGLAVPQVPFPKSMDEAGRQWTADGEDKPTKR